MNVSPETLRGDAAALIDRLAAGARDDSARDRLIVAIAAWQARHVEPYRRLVAARGVDPERVTAPDQLPALPTDVFRHARVAAHPPSEDVRTFHTSGTTRHDRGVHPLRDLSLYDRAARAAARRALFPDVARMRLAILAPDEQEAPHSSLAYMLCRFADWFGEPEPRWLLRDDRLLTDELETMLDRAVADGAPVALLGTSFAFVHAGEALGGKRWVLPPRSRIMQTGGFKGRSREIEPEEMRAMLGARYGVPDPLIVAEYGMTELSSQLYETTLREPEHPRRLWSPGWLRATVVDPDTLRPVPDGEVGILRLDDVANLDTACCIQTSDLARRDASGLVLLGRAPGAVPRGCSIAVDAVLGRAAGESR